jgi:hypothetical protein
VATSKPRKGLRSLIVQLVAGPQGVSDPGLLFCAGHLTLHLGQQFARLGSGPIGGNPLIC